MTCMLCHRLALVTGLLCGAAALAGSISGTVTLSGPRPPPKTLAVGRDQRTCGTSQPDESLVVSATGALENAVVFVENAPKSAAPASPATATLDQVGCRYVPHVQAVRVGTQLTAINSDSVLHTVHGRAQMQTVFNKAMPLQGMRTAFAVTQPGVIRTGCDAGHTWMTAWIYAFEHPYFAVTAPDGTFQIRDLPAGTYTLVAWQERLGAVKQTVQVKGDGAAGVSLIFPAK